jgi:hypothetical protein
MSRRHFVAALTLGLLVFLAPLARAWSPTGAALWPDGSVPIAFGITPSMPTSRPAAEWETAVRAAAASWNNSLQRVQIEVRPTTDSA